MTTSATTLQDWVAPLLMRVGQNVARYGLGDADRRPYVLLPVIPKTDRGVVGYEI
jgi:hypothetical protein